MRELSALIKQGLKLFTDNYMFNPENLYTLPKLYTISNKKFENITVYTK